VLTKIISARKMIFYSTSQQSPIKFIYIATKIAFNDQEF